jgi:2-polyprenyl-6-methoxyphenol hydroxylase-like FAD-dependent oxidoreductase
VGSVVVVGAGPTGLWLAAELAIAGIRCTVVEQRTEVDRRTKGFTIHPRTLEMLAARQLAGRFLDRGRQVPTGHFGLLDHRLDFSGLDTPFPFTLMLTQPETEDLLEEHAVAQGVAILRGRRVTDLLAGPDAVDVLIEDAHDLSADFVVGCDGTRSLVRQTASIDFPGTSATVQAWLGDVSLEKPPPTTPFSTIGTNGVLMIVPMPEGRHRLLGISPGHSPTSDFTFDELRRRTAAILGNDLGMHDPVWLSTFGNGSRLASRYRSGRLFVAGDAAHQHFPAGGVGLNVGMQDAWNLGWKLATVLQGAAPPELLDTYETERRPVGAALLRASAAQTALMSTFTPLGLELRSFLSSTVADVPSFSEFLAEEMSGLGVAYPVPDAHPLAGRRAPDISFADGARLHSLLASARHVLIEVEKGASFGQSIPKDTTVHVGRIAGSRPLWSDVRAALVRPDGHVAWAVD